MECIKEDYLLGNKKIIVGDKMHDLVLENLGRIYIRYGNSYKEFNSIIDSLTTATSTSDSKNIVIETSGLKDASEYISGQLVYDKKSESLYLAYNDELLFLLDVSSSNGERYVKKDGDIMTGSLIINTTDVPLIIRSSKQVNNLNANYLQGITADKFALKLKNELITGDWTFSGNNTFEDVNTFENTTIFNGDTAIRIKSGSLITDGNLGSSTFISGYNGTGWMLDATTNTLTIDNLIVRGILQVFELVVNKISATNGSFWVTDSFKIHSVKLPEFIKITTSDMSYDWNTSDYYIPYKEIHDINDDFNYNEKLIEVNGEALSSRDTKSSDDKIFAKYKYLFKIINLQQFYEFVNDAEILLDENNINELVNKNIIYKINLFQSNNNYESIEEKLIPDYDDDFDTKTWSIIPKDKINNKNEYDPTNICNINLYYKYFGASQNENNYYIFYSEEKEYPSFKPGDIIRCLKFTGKGVKQYHGIVCALVDDYGFLIQLQNHNILNQRIEYEYTNDGELIQSSVTEDDTLYSRGSDETTQGTPQENDALVRIGSIFSGDRLNSLYLTSSEGNSPFMDVIVGVNRPDYTVSYYIPDYSNNEIYYAKLSLNTRVRVGNLSGIHDDKLKNKQPKGYGLYGENVYLVGEFHLNNGKSLLDISNDITAAIGDAGSLQQRLLNIEEAQFSEESLETVVSNYISTNQSSILKLGLDYNLFALGSAGMYIINPDSIVGNGNEKIAFQSESLTINNYVKENNVFKVLCWDYNKTPDQLTIDDTTLECNELLEGITPGPTLNGTIVASDKIRIIKYNNQYYCLCNYYHGAATVDNSTSGRNYIPMITTAALFENGKLNANFIDAERITTRNLIATKTGNYNDDGSIKDLSKSYVKIDGTTGTMDATGKITIRNQLNEELASFSGELFSSSQSLFNNDSTEYTRTTNPNITFTSSYGELGYTIDPESIVYLKNYNQSEFECKNNICNITVRYNLDQNISGTTTIETYIKVNGNELLINSKNVTNNSGSYTITINSLTLNSNYLIGTRLHTYLISDYDKTNLGTGSLISENTIIYAIKFSELDFVTKLYSNGFTTGKNKSNYFGVNYDTSSTSNNTRIDIRTNDSGPSYVNGENRYYFSDSIYVNLPIIIYQAFVSTSNISEIIIPSGLQKPNVLTKRIGTANRYYLVFPSDWFGGIVNSELIIGIFDASNVIYDGDLGILDEGEFGTKSTLITAGGKLVTLYYINK